MTINEDFKIDREVHFIKHDLRQKLAASKIEKKGGPNFNFLTSCSV